MKDGGGLAAYAVNLVIGMLYMLTPVMWSKYSLFGSKLGWLGTSVVNTPPLALNAQSVG